MGAGGAGLRSETAIVADGVERGSAIYIPAVTVRLTAAGQVDIGFVPVVGFTLFRPRYGDFRLGAAPLVLAALNTAAATAGLASLTGASVNCPDTLRHRFIIGVHLVDIRVPPRSTSQNTILVRPATDNVGIEVEYEWEIVRDQLEERGTDVLVPRA